MAKLLFKNKDLLSVIALSEQATAFNLTFSQQIELWEKEHGKQYSFTEDIPTEMKTTNKPQLFFVKDEGIYLMTAAVMEKIPEDKSHVAYAKGYAPTDKDVWEKSRNAVGGDDFAEAIELSSDLVSVIKKGFDISINVTATQFSIRAVGIVEPQKG